MAQLPNRNSLVGDRGADRPGGRHQPFDRLIMGQLGLGLHFVVVEEHKHRGARAPMEQRTIEPAAAGADPAPVGAGAEGRRDHQFGSGQGVRTQPRAARFGDAERALGELLPAGEPGPVGYSPRCAVRADADLGHQQPVPLHQVVGQIERARLVVARQVACDHSAFRNQRRHQFDRPRISFTVIGQPLRLGTRLADPVRLGSDLVTCCGVCWVMSDHAPIVGAMRLFKRRTSAPEPVVQQQEVIPEPVLPDPPPTDERGRRSLAAQRDYLLSVIEPLPAFGMYLLDAWGTAVCEDIVADSHLPADDLAVANGFAVRAGDLEGLDSDATATLRVRDDDKVTKVGSAVQVRAGQVMPEGADAVIPAERGTLDGNVLTVRGRVRSGDHVRWTGSDVRVGVPIMRSGDRLDARRSALLAMAGIDRVLARPRPRVVVLSVADEASDPSDAESHLLAALARADGAQVWRVGLPVGPDRELHDAISDQLIRADIVVASGPLDSDAQLVRVVQQMGEADLADVALEPGGRMGFALVGEDRVPLAMLPDDPVGAYVGYQVFVRPLVRRLMGAPVVTTEQVSCLAGGELTGGLDVVQVRFGTIREQQGEKVVVPLGQPDHPRLADVVGADAMIVLDEESASVQLGERVGCWLLDD